MLKLLFIPTLFLCSILTCIEYYARVSISFLSEFPIDNLKGLEGNQK